MCLILCCIDCTINKSKLDYHCKLNCYYLFSTKQKLAKIQFIITIFSKLYIYLVQIAATQKNIAVFQKPVFI